MFWIEFRQLIKSRLLLVLPFFIVFFVVSPFITGVTKPVVYPNTLFQDAMDARTRLEDLEQDFLKWQSFENYKADLLKEWTEFAGLTDDFMNEEYGAYRNLIEVGWRGDAVEELRDAFSEARRTFMIFYELYEVTIRDSQKVIITNKNYNALVNNIEGLHEYLNNNINYSNISRNDLNIMRGKCHELRGKTKTRQILASINIMSLTVEQAMLLHAKYQEIEIKLNYLPHPPFASEDELILIVDFCDMAYKYLTYHMNLYQKSKLSSSASRYRGFEMISSDAKYAEIVRIEYLLENNKSSLDYSRPLTFRSVMHPPTGSTRLDFVFNCLEITILGLVLFAIFTTVFCIYEDIKKGTIIGSVVSPKSRNNIIWSKLIASWIIVLIVFIIVCIIFLIISSILIPTTTIPSVLFVLYGNFPIVVSATWYFTGYITLLLLKLFFATCFTALLCVIMWNRLWLVLTSTAVCVGALILNFFLRDLLVYQILAMPLIIAAAITAFVFAIIRFKRRDF